MQTTTVSSLSIYLRQVEAGEDVLITVHGRTVGRLQPIATPAPIPEHLRDMEKKRLLKRGKQPLPADFWGLPRPADPQATVRSTVLREREAGW